MKKNKNILMEIAYYCIIIYINFYYLFNEFTTANRRIEK
jgi:hypothetical protein